MTLELLVCANSISSPCLGNNELYQQHQASVRQQGRGGHRPGRAVGCRAVPGRGRRQQRGWSNPPPPHKEITALIIKVSEKLHLVQTRSFRPKLRRGFDHIIRCFEWVGVKPSHSLLENRFFLLTFEAFIKSPIPSSLTSCCLCLATICGIEV